MRQNLNFEGGPWKLRNDMQVGNLVKDGLDESTYYKSPEYETTVWDYYGNAYISEPSNYEYKGQALVTSSTDFDIVESLYNWRYMREKGLE